MRFLSSFGAPLIGYLAALASAQIIAPAAGAVLNTDTMFPLTWDTYGLLNPLNIYLVPGGAKDFSTSVFQIAANVGNTGTYAWTPDKSIAVHESFSIILIDAAQVTFISETFTIVGLAGGSSNTEKTVQVTNTIQTSVTQTMTMTNYVSSITTTASLSSETPPSTSLSIAAALPLFANSSTAVGSTTSASDSVAATGIVAVTVSGSLNITLASDASAATAATTAVAESIAVLTPAVVTAATTPTDILYFNMSAMATGGVSATTSATGSQFTGGAEKLNVGLGAAVGGMGVLLLLF